VIAPRLTALLAMSAILIVAHDAQAQGAFPAPLPGQSAAPASSAPPPMAATAPAPMQSSFPAPMSGGGGGLSMAPSAGGLGAPQGGPAPGAQQECQGGFMELRKEAESKAAAIQAAGKRHAPPQEACKLIGAFSQAEVKMIKYVETNGQKCHIPPDISQQMKKGHVGTEQLLTKVCAAATQAQQGSAAPSLSEALGSTSLPEAKATSRSGGSTFDTLSGNVLSR
jgi:hypothetical protein